MKYHQKRSISETIYQYRNYILFVLMTITFSLYGLKVYVGNVFSTKGTDLYAELEEIRQIKAQNSILHQQILYYSSYVYIEPTAEQMGFTEATDKDYYYLYAK